MEQMGPPKLASNFNTVFSGYSRRTDWAEADCDHVVVFFVILLDSSPASHVARTVVPATGGASYGMVCSYRFSVLTTGVCSWRQLFYVWGLPDEVFDDYLLS